MIHARGDVDRVFVDQEPDFGFLRHLRALVGLRLHEAS